MQAMASNTLANAYKTVHTLTVHGRDFEADVLTKCAVKLNECIQKWDLPDNINRLSESLRLNQRVWTIFQTDIADDSCQLPNDMRVSILRLISFIDKHTFAILMNPEKEKLKILVDININLAAGLQGR